MRENSFFSGVSVIPTALLRTGPSHSALSSPLPGTGESVQSFSLPSSFSSYMDLSDVTLGQPPPPVSHPQRPWAGSVVSPPLTLSTLLLSFFIPHHKLKKHGSGNLFWLSFVN